MPIYEYRCQSCGHELEKLQRLSDPVLTDCPECGKAQLKRLISAAGFRLKGAGWYETDFKQGNQRNLAESSSAKGDNGAGSGAPAGTSETAAKADSSGGGSDKKSSSAASSDAGSGQSKSQSKSEGDSKSKSKSETKSAPKNASSSSAGDSSAAKTA